MMKRLLMWISARLPVRVIKDGDKPYLERYHVLSVFGVAVYLHRFVASDPDRGLHDHPWGWALSVLLYGWYLEERRGYERDPVLRNHVGAREGIVRRGVFLMNWLRGDTFHRVVLSDPASPEVWTLFVHGPKVKPWGFLRPRADSGGRKLQLYVQHVDKDDSDDSSAWAKTAPRGWEIRRETWLTQADREYLAELLCREWALRDALWTLAATPNKLEADTVTRLCGQVRVPESLLGELRKLGDNESAARILEAAA